MQGGLEVRERRGPLTYDEVRDGLISVSHQIRRTSHADPSLLGLYGERNNFMIAALSLRSQGDSRIRLRLVGNENDILHPFDQHRVSLQFGEDRENTTYMTSSVFIKRLREAYSGNFIALLGKPDSYLPENPQQAVERMIREINEIDDAFFDARSNGNAEEARTFTRLKLSLAEKIVLGRRKNLGNARLHVRLLRGERLVLDMLDVEFVNNGKRVGFRMPRYLASGFESIERSVLESGGYDEILDRKRISPMDRKGKKKKQRRN